MNQQTTAKPSKFSRNIRLRIEMLECHCEGWAEKTAMIVTSGWSSSNWYAHKKSDGHGKYLTILRISWLLAMPAQMLHYGSAEDIIRLPVPHDSAYLTDFDDDSADWLVYRTGKGKRVKMATIDN